MLQGLPKPLPARPQVQRPAYAANQAPVVVTRSGAGKKKRSSRRSAGFEMTLGAPSAQTSSQQVMAAT